MKVKGIDTQQIVDTRGVGRGDLEWRLKTAAGVIEDLNGLLEGMAHHYDEQTSIRGRERDQLTSQLTEVQKRCTELFEEARANRVIAKAPPGELVALSHVSHERRRQDEKFGPIENYIGVQFGTGDSSAIAALQGVRKNVLRHEREVNSATCCWGHVLLEECAEALAEPETNPNALREELVQVAAVCVKMIEILDRRANINPPGPTESLVTRLDVLRDEDRHGR